MNPVTINPFELVIKATKDLEGILESGWNAEGKGLHEKLTSVEASIPIDISKRIRWLASIRNKLVHEASFTLDDPMHYEREYLRLRDELLVLASAAVGAGVMGPSTVIKETIPEYTPTSQAQAIVSAARMRRGSSAGFPGFAYLGVLVVVYLFSNLTAVLVSGFVLLVVYALVRMILWGVGKSNYEWKEWTILWGVSLVLVPLLFGVAVI